MSDLTPRKVDVKKLKPFPGNAKKHDLQTIRESLRINGQYKPIVVWEGHDVILAGNGTWEAACDEGMTEIWAVYYKCDAQTAERINVVDNRSNELGGMDYELLVAQLGKMPSLEGTGWSGDDLTAKLLELYPAQDEDESDEGSSEDPTDLPVQYSVIVTCEDEVQQNKMFVEVKKLAGKHKGTEVKMVAI